MRTNVQADQLNWLELLDGAVMAINNAPIAEDRRTQEIIGYLGVRRLLRGGGRGMP